LTDAILRFLNKLVALSEFRGASGADLGTRCLLAGEYAIRAHNAFADPRIQRVPFVLRLGERAGDHAIAAANALPDVVYDGAFLCLMESANGTSRRARGMLAVHAQPAHKLVVLG
jgi:hypothetical protein